jgi:hypothetical protein
VRRVLDSGCVVGAGKHRGGAAAVFGVAASRVMPDHYARWLRYRVGMTTTLGALDRSGLLADLPDPSRSVGKRPSLLRRGARAAAAEREKPTQ